MQFGSHLDEARSDGISPESRSGGEAGWIAATGVMDRPCLAERAHLLHRCAEREAWRRSSGIPYILPRNSNTSCNSRNLYKGVYCGNSSAMTHLAPLHERSGAAMSYFSVHAQRSGEHRTASRWRGSPAIEKGVDKFREIDLLLD